MMLFFLECWIFYVPFPKWFISLETRFVSSYIQRLQVQNDTTDSFKTPELVNNATIKF